MWQCQQCPHCPASANIIYFFFYSSVGQASTVDADNYIARSLANHSFILWFFMSSRYRAHLSEIFVMRDAPDSNSRRKLHSYIYMSTYHGWVGGLGYK